MFIWGERDDSRDAKLEDGGALVVVVVVKVVVKSDHDCCSSSCPSYRFYGET